MSLNKQQHRRRGCQCKMWAAKRGTKPSPSILLVPQRHLLLTRGPITNTNLCVSMVTATITGGGGFSSRQFVLRNPSPPASPPSLPPPPSAAAAEDQIRLGGLTSQSHSRQSAYAS